MKQERDTEDLYEEMFHYLRPVDVAACGAEGAVTEDIYMAMDFTSPNSGDNPGTWR